MHKQLCPISLRAACEGHSSLQPPGLRVCNCTPVSSGPNYCSGISGVICSMTAEASRWSLKSALVPKRFSSNVFSLLDHKALNFLSTNVNFSQLARTRLVYYWFRGFASVAVCVCVYPVKTKCLWECGSWNSNTVMATSSQLVSFLLHYPLS